MVYTLSAIQNESVNRPLHYSIVVHMSFMNLNYVNMQLSVSHITDRDVLFVS